MSRSPLKPSRPRRSPRWLLALVVVLAACGEGDPPPVSTVDQRPAAATGNADDTPPPEGTTLGPWGVELAHVTPSIDPGDDFYRFVNAGWLDTAELPQGFASNGAFVQLHLKTEARVREIVADASLSGSRDIDSPEARVAALHESYMDLDRIEALGLTPLAATLEAILALDDRSEIARMMARPFHISVVGLGVILDPGNPDRHVLSTGQSGLGLPGRDYYLRDDAPFPGHRAAYVDYIASVFERAGIDAARDRAERILAFETRLAQVHWTPEARRDRLRNYHLMTVPELVEYAPGFPWAEFLETLDVADAKAIVVATDTAVAAISEMFAEAPVELLRSYLAFHYLDAHAALLPEVWGEARFDFYSRRLNGIEERRPRAERGIAFVNDTLGELVGRLYVARHFPPEYRREMLDLVDYLRAAFRDRLESLAWMDDTTRAEAFEKLESFVPKIGYPDRWHDYSDLELKPDDLIGNVTRIERWAWADEVDKLDEPPREWEWGMTPQTVNAYYSPTRNEIVFPAAILQPPFFDPAADPAVNFAAIGGVIGHEMGHGFDDQGSRSDATGRLRNWWTDYAREHFDARAEVLVEQYSAFEPIEGLNVNGELTLGENIGDVGGLTIAYEAWRRFAADRYPDGPPILDGYTGDQRFFMGWAQVWRTIQTEDSERRQVLTDPHSPARYRVNGVVRNLDPWHEAFDVSADDALYLPPDRRVQIW